MRGHIAEEGQPLLRRHLRRCAIRRLASPSGVGTPPVRRAAAPSGFSPISSSARHDGTYVPPERITLADYLLERWLPGKTTRVAPSTAGIYERNIRLYIGAEHRADPATGTPA